MSAAAPAMTYANNTVAFADLLASNADRQQRMDQARQEQQETRTIKYADGNKGNHGTKGKIDGGKGNHGKQGEGKPGVLQLVMCSRMAAAVAVVAASWSRQSAEQRERAFHAFLDS